MNKASGPPANMKLLLPIDMDWETAKPLSKGSVSILNYFKIFQLDVISILLPLHPALSFIKE